MFNKILNPKVPKQDLDLTAIPGIGELEDLAAEKCSGGYIIKFYDKYRNPLLLKQNIQGDPNRNPDYSNDSRDAGDIIGIKGEPGATYKLTLDTGGFFGPRSLKLSSKGWSNKEEKFFNLNSPWGYTGYTIDRIS